MSDIREKKKPLWDVLEVSVRLESLPDRDVAACLAWAREHMGAGAWLLAESPRKPIWGEFRELAAEERLKESVFLAIFDEKAEIRFSRPFASPLGQARTLLVDGPDCEKTLVRTSAYALMGRKGSLQFAEHFRPGEDGAWRFAFSRFCGVKGA